jgi:2-octaprenyl-6-methoxyphenol hydroxylase
MALAALLAGAASRRTRIALIDAKTLGRRRGSALDRAVLGQPPAAGATVGAWPIAGHADPPDPRLAPRPVRPQPDRPREHKLPALGYVTRYGDRGRPRWAPPANGPAFPCCGRPA